jgi:hypothetical protein
MDSISARMDTASKINDLQQQQQPILYVKAGELLRTREAFIYMRMIRRGQMNDDDVDRTVAAQFYSLTM